ncbi:hypothetical protein [Shewanella sp. NIFS-20-20]|uniref:hypothetical protein n=1 Tax=Shewanella sp. NIFS-20-20 TaxID=2853806 RepID=UPI001C494F09|nr:hypothetical protein [Shewanella sp. NIFS-20-20]MBV7315416.1 hypothetical protein [Shewanella sp. NIFS-20-20]
MMKINRRHSALDPLSMLIRVVNLLCWLLFFIALGVFHYGRPEIDYGVLRHMDIAIRSEWLDGTQPFLYLLLLGCALLSITAFYLLKRRSRRQGDHRGYNLVSVLAFSVGLLLLITL